MASKYDQYEARGQQLVNDMHKGLLFKQVCVEGHGDERHQDASDVSLMETIIEGKKAASAFYPGLYDKALEYFIEFNAASIAEWLDNPELSTQPFYVDLDDEDILGEGYAVDNNSIVRKSTTTAAIVLCLNEKGSAHYNPYNHYGFTILTAYPEIIKTDEATVIEDVADHDSLSVLKQTNIYQNASDLQKIYLETLLNPNINASYSSKNHESMYIDIDDSDTHEEHHIQITSNPEYCRYSVSDIGDREKKKITDMSLPEARGKRYASLTNQSTCAYLQTHFPEEAAVVFEAINRLGLSIKTPDISIKKTTESAEQSSKELNESLLREQQSQKNDDQYN